MPRPVKCRLIESEPHTALFKPRGIPATMLEEVTVGLEELEAVRLKDIEGLDQAAAASRMNVSRPTFQRILASARVKISDALVHGKAIRIEGGTYSLCGALLKCRGCGHEWRSTKALACPNCACENIGTLAPEHRRCSGRQRCRTNNEEEQ